MKSWPVLNPQRLRLLLSLRLYSFEVLREDVGGLAYLVPFPTSDTDSTHCATSDTSFPAARCLESDSTSGSSGSRVSTLALEWPKANVVVASLDLLKSYINKSVFRYIISVNYAWYLNK